MTKNSFLAVVFILGIAMISCKNNQNKPDAANADTLKTAAAAPKYTTSHKQVYTCPMHPEEVSDKPGKCPKCGMDLELKS
jgi:hypothetical protein